MSFRHPAKKTSLGSIRSSLSSNGRKLLLFVPTRVLSVERQYHVAAFSPDKLIGEVGGVSRAQDICCCSKNSMIVLAAATASSETDIRIASPTAGVAQTDVTRSRTGPAGLACPDGGGRDRKWATPDALGMPTG